MNRRGFVGATAPQPNEAAPIKRAVEFYYAAYRELDQAKYHAGLTDDYARLENGELHDINGDLTMMGNQERAITAPMLSTSGR